MESFLSASEVARLLNIRIGTLSKWRRQGKGPSGWRYASKTLVLYPVASVRTFVAAMPTTAELSRMSLRNLHTEDIDRKEP